MIIELSLTPRECEILRQLLVNLLADPSMPIAVNPPFVVRRIAEQERTPG